VISSCERLIFVSPIDNLSEDLIALKKQAQRDDLGNKTSSESSLLFVLCYEDLLDASIFRGAHP
jgi:hypothetical protein